MALNVYTGVNGIARKVTRLYFGVGGKARAVQNGFIGVNGVARQFYTLLPRFQYVKGYWSTTEMGSGNTCSFGTIHSAGGVFENGKYKLYLNSTRTNTSLSGAVLYSTVQFRDYSFAGKSLVFNYTFTSTGGFRCPIQFLNANGSNVVTHTALPVATNATRTFTIPSGTVYFEFTLQHSSTGSNQNASFYINSMSIGGVQVI